MQMIEHPAVAKMERDGYLTAKKLPHCERCGEELVGYEKIFTFDGQEMCSECAKECIEDSYSLSEIAEALNIPARFAG